MVRAREGIQERMNQHAKALREKITARKAKLGVVGLGYVGLPLAVEFAHAGFRIRARPSEKRVIMRLASGGR